MPQKRQATIMRVKASDKAWLLAHLATLKDSLGEVLEHTELSCTDDFMPVFADSYTRRFMAIADACEFIRPLIPSVLLEKSSALAQQFSQRVAAISQEFSHQIQLVKATHETAAYQDCLERAVSELTACVAAYIGLSKKEAMFFLSKGEEYQSLIRGRPSLVTVSSLGAGKDRQFVVQVEQPLAAISASLKDELWAIRQDTTTPPWYQEMHPMEQRILLYVLKDICQSKADISDYFANYSSKLRTLPGLANFRKHTLLVLDERGKVVVNETRLASSMVSQRDRVNSSQVLRDFYTVHNLRRIIDEDLPARIKAYEAIHGVLLEGETIHLPFLVQTLVSPVKPLHDAALVRDKLSGIAIVRDNYKSLTDVAVINARGESVTIKLAIDIFSLNHPFNYVRYLDWTSSSSAECLRLIARAKDFVKKEQRLTPARKNIINELIDGYQAVLEVGVTDVAYDVGSKVQAMLGLPRLISHSGRELFLSSYSQLLVSKMEGIAYGSCVSGKDRKGLLLLHSDAMLIYKQRYQAFPRYDDTGVKRQRFVDIFATLYITRHHHVSAGQNAPGAEGIKTPAMYLPTDLADGVQQAYLALEPTRTNPLAQDDALADKNTMSKMVKTEWFNPRLSIEQGVIKHSKSKPNLMAKATTDIKMQLALTTITSIVEAESFWAQKTSSLGFVASAPKGIGSLRRQLKQSASLASLFGELRNIALSRGSSGHHRYPVTQRLYDCIMALPFCEDNPLAMDTVLAELQSMAHEIKGVERALRSDALAVQDDGKSPLTAVQQGLNELLPLMRQVIFAQSFWDKQCGYQLKDPRHFSCPAGVYKMREFMAKQGDSSPALWPLLNYVAPTPKRSSWLAVFSPRSEKTERFYRLTKQLFACQTIDELAPLRQSLHDFKASMSNDSEQQAIATLARMT